MIDLVQALRDTQAYLRSGKTLAQFEAEHGIRGKVEGPHLILDYDQIAVKWAEPYGYICRGLVLDANTFEVIACGLGKFFNDAEHYAAPIDWDSAKVFEKIDGTMVNRWWSPHTNRFEYSTRFQLPDGLKTNLVNSGVICWQDMIDRCMTNVGSRDDGLSPLDLQPMWETWTFEVCSMHNMVVVRHADYHAKLLAIRNNISLQEESVESRGHGASTPRSYCFINAAEVAEFANQHAATELEGFVVVDGAFNRVKIKSDQYVALHRAKDGLKGINNLILLAKSNDYEEVVVHFPEYKYDLDVAAAAIERVVSAHELIYEECRGIENQKEFAIAIMSCGLEYPAALFTTRAGKSVSVRQSFMDMNDTGFCKLFKTKVRLLLSDRYQEEE